jgi:hypothetical protein
VSLLNIRYVLWTLRLRGQRLIPFSGRMSALFVAPAGLASSHDPLSARARGGDSRAPASTRCIATAAPKRPRLRSLDRLLWVLLSIVWPNWRQAAQIVTPAKVVRWHRRAFAAYGRWNSRSRRIGRPALASDLRVLIRRMREANPLWGAPRILRERDRRAAPIGKRYA